MGRIYTISRAEKATSTAVVFPARAVDLLVGSVMLTLVLPLMGLLAVAVRTSSHGRILHREPGVDPRGRRVELLSFRTMLDGGGTEAHERLRAVVGAHGQLPLTPVGRLLRVTRLERLPRLINLVAGHSSLF